jgi:hydrocephalus-inducing protein
VEPENFLEVYVQFCPPLVGEHEGELIVSYNNSIERMYCKLYGVGLELDVGLSADNVVAIPTYIGRSSQMVFQLQNYSSIVAYFIWKKFATEKEDASYLVQVEASDKGHPQRAGAFKIDTRLSPLGTLERAKSPHEMEDNFEKAFTLSPANGECWPNSRTQITITFSPPRAFKYYCKAFCKISGKSQRLAVQLEGTGIRPVTQFVPCKLDLQDLSLFSSYEYEVQLKNLGDMEAKFKLCCIDTKCASFKFNPSEGVIPIMQSQPIKVNCYTQIRGTFETKFVWNVEGTQFNPTLSFRASIGNPLICIDTKAIEFGLFGLGFSSHFTFNMRNCSQALLNFKFYIVQNDQCNGFLVSPEFSNIKPQ